MLVNTNLALYPIKEAKSYGTGITTSPYELVQTLKSRALKGITELSASLNEDATLGYQLFQSLFKGDYTFPNKRALRLIENVSHTEGRFIPFMSSYATLEGEGPEIGKPTILSRLGGCAVRCHGCFLATDTIMTSAGLKYLYDVKEGDWLYTFDEDYNLTKTQVTKALHQIVDPDQLVRVYYQERLNNGKLVTKSKICTDDHEWNVKKKGWVEAKNLKKGQIVYHLNNVEVFKAKHSENNPMHRPEVATKMGATNREQYANGREPSRMGKKAAKKWAKHMRENNPMYQQEIVSKMLLNKEYPKSRAEKILHFVLSKRLGVKVQYVGGGKNKLLIGDNDFGYYMPDFIIKGTNKVIESYSTTYPMYKEDRSSLSGRKSYETIRRNHYKKFGYEVLFIRYEDHLPCAINERTTQDKVIDMPLSSFNTLSKRINKYIHNGVKILKVEYLNNKAKAGLQRQYDNRKTASDYVSIVNFSCAPYNHFLIDGVHVHNCDTPNSWNANTEKFDGEVNPMRNEYNQVLQISDIADLIVQQADCYGIKRVSITGGEPLHYIDSLRLLVADLWLRGFYINIETSGTLFDPVIFAMCHVSVDIKTPSSRVKLSDHQIGALHAVASYDHANPAHIKAVILDKEDLSFILDMFPTILNGEGTYRPICLTPWAAATQEKLDVGSMSSNVQEITNWIFNNKGHIDTRQVRVIGQQHKLFSFA
jgi:organic radical activating enzyme